MKRLVDIVNFNPDASCLPSARWLQMIEGGSESALCKWLSLYVRLSKPVTLGFVGCAVADMAMLNPESIELINRHPDIFEIIQRPFSHDIGLLRSAGGFERNVKLGRAVLASEFGRAVNFFLPPEFMLTNVQVRQLSDMGYEGVFTNPVRFKSDLRGRLPTTPYLIEGVLGSRLKCIPFEGSLTDGYLTSIHTYDAGAWNDVLTASASPLSFSWRDGESSFLIPDGLNRELAWLESEDVSVVRQSLTASIGDMRFERIDPTDLATVRSYPTHSFAAWFKESRMLGYLGRLNRYEARALRMSDEMTALWLQAINSDILSAVEKDSPIVTLKSSRDADSEFATFTIWRTERGFEGEDYLARLERLNADNRESIDFDADEQPHIRKLKVRSDYLRGMNKDKTR